MEFTHNPGFCSLSTSKAKYRRDIFIEPHSSYAVPFIIVPLSLGLHDVEVKAAVFEQFLSDGIKKKLKVVVSMGLDDLSALKIQERISK